MTDEVFAKIQSAIFVARLPESVVADTFVHDDIVDELANHVVDELGNQIVAQSASLQDTPLVTTKLPGDIARNKHA